MRIVFQKDNLVKFILCFFISLMPLSILADEDYSSELVNQSKHSGSNGYKLVRTKIWPNNSCITEAGKKIIFPGESTILKIKKTRECQESGIGYSIYKSEDTKNEHLLGYLSHRLGEGKFSVQVSRFCEGKQCIFWDLNPAQGQR